jgi:hypothetical protein
MGADRLAIPTPGGIAFLHFLYELTPLPRFSFQATGFLFWTAVGRE